MRRVFRLPGSKRRIHDELDTELRFHLEGRIEDLMEREGLSREDAEREARRRFGDFETYKNEARVIDDNILQRSRQMDVLETLKRETRHAARTLLRSPSFSLIAIVTLALGLGAATTIFTLLDRVVLRPLPYPHADRMIHISTLWLKGRAGEEYALSKGQYFYFKKHSRVLSDLLLYDGSALVVPGDGTHPTERVSELDVSANTFALLGIRPELGRLFTAEDELNPDGDPRVLLLSHGYWQRRFGGDPHVIGTRIPYGDHTAEVIGVLPAGASLPDAKADVWLRNALNPAIPPQNNHTHSAIGVLKPGVTLAAATDDIKRVQTQMEADYPNVYSPGFLETSGFAIKVTTLRDSVVGGTIVRALWLLFAAVGLVLLIAAANVANLFLVRIDARRREVAVRAALGADRSHLAVHYLTESMLLALVAGVGAIVLGSALLHVVLAIAPQSLPRLDEVTFDWRSIAFCFSAALAFGIVFGLAPLTATTVDVMLLREGGRGLTSSPARELARRGLVLSQVALAVILLSSAALMAKSFAHLRDVRPGFDPAGVITMQILVPYPRYRNEADVVAFWRDFTSRVEKIPGVVHAGATGSLPLLNAGGCSGVITDAVEDGKQKGHCMPMTMVTPGYFETMGIKVRGALPTWSSIETGSGPTVVTAAFAKRFWHDENPIGHRIKVFRGDNPDWTVVGVAEDIRALGLQSAPIEEVYFPLVSPAGTKGGWGAFRSMVFVVRAPGLNQATLVARVRQVIGQVDPQVPVSDIMPMTTIVAKSTAQTSFTMLLLLMSATIALALSAVGIYGVISYVVGQRRAEIGIRMALGAQVAEVSRMIVTQSLALASAGVVVGLLAAISATRFLRSLLFEVSPNDPFVLAGTAVVLLLVAGAASFGPTRRAAKIDPVEAMRGG